MGCSTVTYEYDGQVHKRLEICHDHLRPTLTLNGCSARYKRVRRMRASFTQLNYWCGWWSRQKMKSCPNTWEYGSVRTACLTARHSFSSLSSFGVLTAFGTPPPPPLGTTQPLALCTMCQESMKHQWYCSGLWLTCCLVAVLWLLGLKLGFPDIRGNRQAAHWDSWPPALVQHAQIARKCFWGIMCSCLG